MSHARSHRGALKPVRSRFPSLLPDIHLLVLGAFAVTQPLLDLLGRHAGFFVARGIPSGDVWALTAVLSLAVPGAFAVIYRGFHAWTPLVGGGIHSFLVALLVCLCLMPAWKYVPFLPGPAVLAVSAAGGLFAAWLYRRYRSAHTFLTVLSPVILLFPVLFLFHSPVSRILFHSGVSLEFRVSVQNPAPVILVVFDELPALALMNEDMVIDPVRFPNLAALAEDATWFRQASTVAESTEMALPALLTGRYPDQPRLPFLADVPDNLFTLLAGTYRLNVTEPVTALSPSMETPIPGSETRFARRLLEVLSDLSLVYLHRVLPGDYSQSLPAVNRAWEGFRRGSSHGFMGDASPNVQERLDAAFRRDRAEMFMTFVRSIRDLPEPALHFLHVLLPHSPYEYLPSGKLYARGDCLYGLDTASELWNPDEAAVRHALQRYLLQVGFVDRLVGDLMEHLKAQDLYDRALIVLTSDHGVSFVPGDHRRHLTESNRQDILSTLLIIKAPGQREGRVSDRNAESVDVLPTLAHLLGFEAPWPMDGRSLWEEDAPQRNVKVVFSPELERRVFNPPWVSTRDRLVMHWTPFASGNLPDERRGAVSSNRLVGRPLRDMRIAGNTGIRIVLERQDLFDTYDPALRFVPCHIVGRFEPCPPKAARLAVSVHGTIFAETAPTEYRSGECNLSVIVPEQAFRKGSNRVEVFLVGEPSEPQDLIHIPHAAKPRYASLELDDAEQSLKDGAGRSYRIRDGALRGFLDFALIEGDIIRLLGWAADVEAGELPEAVVVVSGGNTVYHDRTNYIRPDVADHFDKPELIHSGFQFHFPLEELRGGSLRIFALSSSGLASELEYGELTAEFFQD